MFKPTSGTWPNEASTKYVDKHACETYKLGSNYNCDADVPNPYNSSQLAEYRILDYFKLGSDDDWI